MLVEADAQGGQAGQGLAVTGAAADDDVDLWGHPGIEEAASNARVEFVGAEGVEEAVVGWGCKGYGVGIGGWSGGIVLEAGRGGFTCNSYIRIPSQAQSQG